MTLLYYIAADRELPTGSFGQRRIVMKLRDYLMQTDPAAMEKFPVKGMIENGTLGEKRIDVYETPEDAAGLYITGPLAQQDSSHMFKKALVYQVNPEGGDFKISTVSQKQHPGAYVTGRKCLMELFHYLDRNLVPGEQFELYSCTAYGTERFLEPRRRELDRRISLSSFRLEEDFEWQARQYMIVSR